VSLHLQPIDSEAALRAVLGMPVLAGDHQQRSLQAFPFEAVALGGDRPVAGEPGKLAGRERPFIGSQRLGEAPLALGSAGRLGFWDVEHRQPYQDEAQGRRQPGWAGGNMGCFTLPAQP
jgi:hypothetical protein